MTRIRTHALRLDLTPREAIALSRAAARHKRTVSAHIRAVIGLPGTDQTTTQRPARGAQHGAHRRVKVHVSVEERDAVHAAAIALDMTTLDYLRVSLGMERLRPRRVKAGAPIGNRNRAVTRRE